MDTSKISILGCGNIGSAIAMGLKKSGEFSSKKIHLTRRKNKTLKKLETQGFKISSDNKTQGCNYNTCSKRYRK